MCHVVHAAWRAAAGGRQLGEQRQLGRVPCVAAMAVAPELDTAILSLFEQVVAHMDRLVQLVLFEEVREKGNPALPGLRTIISSLEDVLLSHGIERVAPKKGEALSEVQHERRSVVGAKPAVRQSLDESLVSECLRPGYRHSASGKVFCRALVTTYAKPAATAAPSVVPAAVRLADTAARPGAPSGDAVRAALVQATAEAVGGGAADAASAEPALRVHTVEAGDTLEKLALRYHVQARLASIDPPRNGPYTPHRAGGASRWRRRAVPGLPPAAPCRRARRGDTRARARSPPSHRLMATPCARAAGGHLSTESPRGPPHAPRCGRHRRVVSRAQPRRHERLRHQVHPFTCRCRIWMRLPPRPPRRARSASEAPRAAGSVGRGRPVQDAAGAASPRAGG
eukprot:4558471-Prymnesium_polylepis.2